MRKGKRMKLVLIGLLTFSFLIAWVSEGSAAPAAPKVMNLFMGSTTSSSGMYPACVVLARVINKHVPEVRVTVLETGATHDNIQRLAKKQVQLMAASGVDGTSMAYHGIAKYEGNPVKTVRMVILYYLTFGAYVVRADSGVKTLRDLHGKRFYTGIPGSSGEYASNTVFKILGIQPQIIFGSLGDAMDMMKENRIVGLMRYPALKSLDSTIVDVNTHTPVRLLSFTEEEITKVIPALPGNARIDIPAGTVLGLRQQGPVLTYSSGAGLFATSDLPAELVYRMIKGIVAEWQKELVPIFAEAAQFHAIKDTIRVAGSFGAIAPLHAGAVRYFMEQGYEVPAKLIPPEWKK